MKRVFLPQPGFENYVAALRALGAEPQSERPEDCAALLLPGGGDIHPRRYGQPLRGSVQIDEARDAVEWAAFFEFFRAGKPILGICRGCQLVNVALGGTLRQDIPNHSAYAKGHDRLHGSRTDDPLLRELYGARFPVNSAHHQAVDALGEGLRPVQWAEDGTVEALRHVAAPLFAVQWHPERLRSPTDGWRLLAAWLERV